uniref:Uncharacterized protein n=1 Tax=Fagus sylvatica TaxID=28930 RepID=A0A2N9HB33_FAGSY
METNTPKVLIPIANGIEPMEAMIMLMFGNYFHVRSQWLLWRRNSLSIDATYGIKIHANAFISNCANNVFDLIALPV